MEVFLFDQNSVTGRYAIFEDDGISGWLYLTNVGDKKPIADCWIYNRIPAPDLNDIDQYRDGPPPATSNYTKEEAQVVHPENLQLSFLWSSDGNSVALLNNSSPLGFIQMGKKRGWSQNLKYSGPWGQVFDEQIFEELFSYSNNS